MDGMEKLKKLQGEIELAERKIRFYEDRKKSIRAGLKKMTRSERTHRLIVRGAMLEAYLPHPERLTDEQVGEFLKEAFRCGEVTELVNRHLKGRDFDG